ncbi:sulfite exporter TauE/SafE family protein [Sutcliffiella cohnii]
MDSILWLLFIGFIATFIGTLGGGGGLISLPAMLSLGVPIHAAIAANKFSNTFSSLSSFYTLWKKKEVDFPLAFSLVPFTVAGGITGAFLASQLQEKTLLTIALVLLIFSTFLNLLKEYIKKWRNRKKNLFRSYYFFIGAFDGFFGPGQAILLMHSFLTAGYSYVTSIGLARFQTFASCIVSFSVYAYLGFFQPVLGILLAIGSFCGAQLAVKLAPTLSHLPWKSILTFVSLLLIIYIVVQI